MIQIDHEITSDIINFRKETNQPLENQFDKYGIFVSYYLGNKIVGNERIIICDDLDKSEYIYYGHSVAYPIVSSFAEGGMIYILPEHRDLSIMKALVNEFVSIARHCNVKYIVGASEEKLWKLYKRLGFSFMELKNLKARDKLISSVLFFKEV